ncbi:hypothetical protein BJ993_000811 [Nocardioides aromaticivorans]|uniref:Uncharacterized protein n=1 Tax=Nocardioides aromaticivorans TaxID=200618 RepID=A0A7Y9ZEW6_9ACTN|nr:hypothetical protein [Nocardioides aromaticivorans]NYI43731.1 hypothetical protein [Nocardioides aromaticivorans]
MHGARRLGPISTAATALVLLLTTACGTESSSRDDGPAPLPDDTYRRVLAQGVDPDLVHTIELAGFELAEQSAGVFGDADYGATYVPVEAPYTTEVHLTVRAGTYDAGRCATEPLPGPTGGSPAPVESCEPDAGGWYRTGGGWQEYVVLDAGHVLALSGPTERVDRDDLVAAALGARHQDGGDITPATPSSPVTRGDLPTTGDGAPVDPYGTSAPGG